MNSKRWMITILGMLIIAVAMTVFFFKKPGGELNQTNLSQAEELWRQKGLKNYHMTISVTGAQEELHQIKVANGSVISMTTNGADVKPSVWEYWNVEGMFQFLERELEQTKAEHNSFGTKQDRYMHLGVNFNKNWGYPQNFFRYVRNHPSNIQWTITEFKIL